jgi:hypothetical protein
VATYISADELRAHLGGATGVEDAVLIDYIDALEAEIDRRFGVLEPVTVHLEPAPGSELLVLPRRARSIVSIVEWDAGPVEGQTKTTLAANDYERRSTYLLARLGTGTNPAGAWSGYGVDVTYLPHDDSAERKLVVVGVAKLEASTIGLGTVGGATIKIGDYSETSGGGGAGGGLDAKVIEGGREAILSRLRHRRIVFA